MQIITTYHPALFLICALFGAAVSGFLYYRDKNLNDFSRNLKLFLTTLRFVGVTLMAFFLLEPMLKFVRQELEKPVIVIGLDNSESVVLTKDSVATKALMQEGINELQTALGDRFEVRTYLFGDKIVEEGKSDFSDKETNVSELIDELYNRYSNRNLGAVILATDGIYNRGFNPVHEVQKIKAPIFSIALGDTTKQKDALIKEVLNNQLAYLGNDFPLEVLVESFGYPNESTNLKVIHKGNQIAQSGITFNQSTDQQAIRFNLQANATGIQRYTIQLESLNDEFTLVNNTQDIFIEVLDSKQKILVLANSPHPDITAIKNALDVNENYDVEILMAKEAPQVIEKYNLVVLHGLPSEKNPINNLVTSLKSKDIPAWIIMTGQTDLNQLNTMNAGINISGVRKNSNDVVSVYNQSFSLFNLDAEEGNYFGKLPPMRTPFGQYKVTSQGQVLFHQRIGSVKTEFPLLVFCDNDNWKTAILTGEGLWRWRLLNYSEKNNHDYFNTLIQKTIQYLAAKKNKSFFKILGAKNFSENEEIVFRAERYNKSYELITEPEIQMVISDEQGNTFDFNFSRSGNGYRLSAGVLPTGNYSYKATSNSDDGQLVLEGEFSVTAINIESNAIVANHKLLYQLSSQTGGAMLLPSQIDSLATLINNNQEIAGILYTKKELADLINLRWIFFILLALFAIEWFIRKRNGAY